MKQTEEKKTGGTLKWYVLGALILGPGPGR